MLRYYEDFYSKYVKSLEETTGANIDRYVLALYSQTRISRITIIRNDERDIEVIL